MVGTGTAGTAGLGERQINLCVCQGKARAVGIWPHRGSQDLEENAASRHSRPCTFCTELLFQGRCSQSKAWPRALWGVLTLHPHSAPPEWDSAPKWMQCQPKKPKKPSRERCARQSLAVPAAVNSWFTQLHKAELPSLGRRGLQILHCSTALYYQHTISGTKPRGTAKTNLKSCFYFANPKQTV